MPIRSNDELLALKFLRGWVVRKPGKIFIEYFTAGSDLEHEAKNALARLLVNNREPLSADIRLALALLIYPDGSLDPREFVFQRRHGGRRRLKGAESHPMIDWWISAELEKAIAAGTKIDAAVAWVAEQFGVSERFVRRVRARPEEIEIDITDWPSHLKLT
jgi:hypothetical protein